MIYYIYDDGILGLKHKGNMYYYQKNYQDDIIGIYDSNYNLVVTYKYDAGGKVISILDNTIEKVGTINPFRYRSYYYDEETKLYYLNSRYYNPEWCRFINPDNYIKFSMSGNNLYLYTENSPVNNIDTSGKFFKKIGKFFSSCYNNSINFVAEKYNVCKKVISKNVIDLANKFGDVFKPSLVFESGSGTGFSLIAPFAVGKVGANYTTNHVVKVKNDEVKEYLESTQGLTLGIAGFSQTYVDLEDEGINHYPTTYIIGPVEVSLDNRTIFIGESISLHFFVGGYIKAGLELEW